MMRSVLLAVACGVIPLSASSPALPAQLLPVYGGADGTAFTRSCGTGKVLTGLRFRDGLLVDAVGLLCRPVNANGTLGSETTVGTLVGGSGGTSGTVSCGSSGVVTGGTIKHGSYVSFVSLRCRVWETSSRSFTSVGATGGSFGSVGTPGAMNEEACEARTQPVTGMRGRSHSLVDAIGFICDEP